MDAVLGFFQRLPALLVYVVLGVGAALENVVPPIPADTFVLLGGFLAAHAILSPLAVFFITWGANVVSAFAMYWVGAAHGPSFFEHGWGRHLLNHHQRSRMNAFYERFGVAAVFFTRFLPGLRSVVPPTAGLARLAWWKVMPPLAIASAIWYGALVWLGFTAGNHLDTIKRWIDQANLALLAIALVIFGAIGVWWWRTRKAVHTG